MTTGVDVADEVEGTDATDGREGGLEAASETITTAPALGGVLAVISASLAAAAAIVGVILLTLLRRQHKLEVALAAGDHRPWATAR